MAPRMQMHRYVRNGIVALGLIGQLGCGDSQEDAPETPYGSVEEVREYRLLIDPIVAEVNEVEMEVQRTAVGSSGQATAANLAAAYEVLKPRLQAVLEALNQVEPPALLAPLHRDIRKLITLRLEAFNTLLEGREAENEELYEVAEAKLVEANALIPELNQELEKIDMVLAEAEEENPVASGKRGVGHALRFR